MAHALRVGIDRRPTPSTIALLAISVLVFAVTILVALAGYLLVMSGLGPILFVFGLGLLGLAFVLRPRFRPVPEVLDRGAHPDLYAVPDAVADALGTRRVHGIVITPDFNAGVFEAGIRRRRVMYLGLPLMAVLDPSERVAVIGHELGHFVNGDPMRGFVASEAMATLVGWYSLLHPGEAFDSPDEDVAPGILMAPINLFMAALSQIPLAVARGVGLLALADGQRGEYNADLLAARLAGRDALTNAWHKFHLGRTVQGITASSTTEHWVDGSLWREIERQVRSLPTREIDRAARIDLLDGNRLDASHPPTAYRIKLVETRGEPLPSPAISAEASARFEAAIRSHDERIGRELVEDHRATLYY